MRKRVESVIAELSKEEGSFLLVTHGDVIKMFIATALDLPIDRFQSFVSEPASITSISLGKKRNTILQINYKLTASDLTGFKVNQLGGGNLLTNSQRWWRK
jgi:probable phosphoglycerate mutase